eukprot:4448173-Pyramimonas_sp.AAC.1
MGLHRHGDEGEALLRAQPRGVLVLPLELLVSFRRRAGRRGRRGEEIGEEFGCFGGQTRLRLQQYLRMCQAGRWFQHP